MKTILLAGLLMLAALLQGQARGSWVASHLAAGTQLLPGGTAVAVEDTTKSTSFRLLSLNSAPIASVRPRIGQYVAAAPEAARADSAAAVSLGVSEAPEFNPETADIPAALAITLRRPAAPLGRRTYRTRLVRTGRWASRSEAVEILTCTYAGPLVLAQLPAAGAAPAQVLAGPGYDQAAPLRALELTQAAVLRLCGDRAPQVQAYAMLYNLRFQQATDVARLLDYYNRIAVVK